MKYRMTIHFDDGERTDQRCVYATRVDVLVRRAKEAARRLLTRYYKREYPEGSSVAYPLPLVAMDAQIEHYARAARCDVGIPAGSPTAPLPGKLGNFRIEAIAER
jgi:hypothetical protein